MGLLSRAIIQHAPVRRAYVFRRSSRLISFIVEKERRSLVRGLDTIDLSHDAFELLLDRAEIANFILLVLLLLVVIVHQFGLGSWIDNF